MSFVADTIPTLEIVREQAAPEDRPTRLLCARYYMYSLPIALLDFFRLAGPPCAGFERTVGLDRRRFCFTARSRSSSRSRFWLRCSSSTSPLQRTAASRSSSSS